MWENLSYFGGLEGKSWRRQWHATPVLLPGKSHGRRSLVGCSPWGRYESDTTEWLHFHFSLSHNGEGNGNPLQCSCLENPRDRGACWAAVYGVARSWTRLTRLSSSSRIQKLSITCVDLISSSPQCVKADINFSPFCRWSTWGLGQRIWHWVGSRSAWFLFTVVCHLVSSCWYPCVFM